MKTVKLFAVSAALVLGALTAGAQDFATGYFLGGYQYAYRMNPAFASEHNFFSVGLGQLGANIQSDFGVSDFVKKTDDGYVLFMNDAVTAEDFLSGFNKDELNKLSLNTNVNLISKGSWNKEKVSFSTFDVSVKSATDLALPYDLFRFLKEGTSTNPNFDFSGTGVQTRNYLELAFGTTRIIKNKFSFGIRLKGLVGLANANLNMEELKLNTSGSTWTYTSKGSLSASVPFASMKTDADGYYDFSSFNLDMQKIAKNIGFGGAVDAGLSINLVPWLTISGAILDFGAVNWMDEIKGTAAAAGTYTPSDDGDTGQFTQFLNSLEGVYKFKAEESNAKTGGGGWENLPYRLNAGVELRLPFYQRFSLGALYTMYNGDFTFNANDILLSANWTPLNFLSASVSSRLGDQFSSFGGAINLHPSLFNLFVGIDVIPTKLLNIGGLLPDSIPAAVKQYAMVPADDLNLNAYVGLSFALGKRQIDYRKMSRKILKEQKEKAEQKAQEKKEKEEQKAKDKELKEYEKLQAEEAKAAKAAEKEAAAQAKADEKAAKEQAAAEAKAAKDAAAKAKADAKAAKEAEKAAKAQEKAAKAAEKAAAKNAEVEAATAKMEAEKAEKAAAAEAAAAEEAAKEEATGAEALLESVLEQNTEKPAEETTESKPSETSPEVPQVFEFPTF